MNRLRPLLAVLLLLAAWPRPARAVELNGIFTTKPPAAAANQVTVEQIRTLQDQLRLLQDKLRAQEKRKAQEAAAQDAGEGNWQEIDQTHLLPGQFGIYTYLLYAGSETDPLARKSLEHLLQTIEALPTSADPTVITNRFLLPVAPQQTQVVMARRPYDFKLSRAYLERLGLKELAAGPVLVSLTEPLDPFGQEMVQPYLAVVLGRQELRHSLALVKVWHGYEKPPLPVAGHPLADLFWQLVDGAGPTRVSRSGGRLLIDLTPAVAAAP